MQFCAFASNRALTTAVLLGTLALGVRPAAAHFQLIYTPEVNVTHAGDLPVRLIFWHPFDNGHAMDMGPPEQFYMVHRGQRSDLSNSLTPIAFIGAENTAQAYAAVLPVKRSGDYVMVAVPAPYYESSEDIYIQQITKSMVNRNGIPTDWDQALGLKAEIVPLNRPTNILAGSTFSGKVLSQGKPVAGVSVEIEYIAALPDLQTNKALPPTAAPPQGGTLVAITDDNGVFTFGVPKAGFWGFAALGIGPDQTHQGKTLSQDAVLWIRAYDMQQGQ